MVDIKNIKTFVVIGAGTMGREIAQVALMAGFENVVLNDIQEGVIEDASKYIQNGLRRLENKGLLSEGQKTDILMTHLIKESDLKKAVQNADFIVEAIPEIMDLKQELFHEIGNIAPEQAIFATNTSTMSITDIASTSGREDKVIGMHFFTPVVLLRLIELIKGSKTSQETFDRSYEVSMKFPSIKGKRYIAKINKESPGFIVNRLTIASSLYLSWMLEYATEKGISYELLDNDIIAAPNLGPFAKWDFLGLDIIRNVQIYFAKTLSPEFTPCLTLQKLVDEGKLGKKTGSGLYEWDAGKIIRKSKEKANLLNIEIYYAIQLNEGCRLLEEGIVANYKIIDDTMLAGMDMPGPFSAGKRNYKKWTQMLESFSKESGIKYIKPTKLMATGDFIQMKK
ncbi:MAG: 3-hydroxyacyl-CoA dehydrogenase family protein [Candidatus Lokiarchaeota archaeon]|nr:3-hydroxyacyl-CoA dehydrogenase family protein [Candidatus Lokiarchaeota archaeon]